MMNVAERINGERIVLAGWSRAILLQLAHPLVAQGVADHSSFQGGFLRAAIRLHHTVLAMRQLTFGPPEAARQALAGIRTIHKRVNGRLRVTVGPWQAGTPYSAEDPDLVLWVHATLLDSLALVHDAIVAPLTDADRDAWCRESAPLAEALGARAAEVPERWADLQAYLASKYEDGSLVVGDTARMLSRDVLTPPRSWVIAPVRRLNSIVTIGLLPASIRSQYRLPWRSSDDARLRRSLWLLRSMRRATPRALAYWPEAR